jgi:hypothetical protein
MIRQFACIFLPYSLRSSLPRSGSLKREEKLLDHQKMMMMSIDLPDALSPHTRHTAELFVDELDEFESAADDVVVVLDDEAGEKG